MKELDKKDYLLLDILGKGSRKSPGRMAKELKMHKNSVLYRINRLRRMGVIKYFTFIPGYAAIGKDTFYVFFRLKLNAGEKEDVYSYLKNHPLTLEVARLSGSWTVMIELVCDNLMHFNDELAGIVDYLGDRLSDYKTVLLYVPYKVEPYVNFEKGYVKEPFEPPKKHVELDDLDRRILGVLADSSDISYNDLAKKAKTTSDTAFYRVKKLTADGVIRKFVPKLDMEKLGFQNYKVMLKLSNISRNKLESMKNYLANNGSINFCFSTAGELGVVIYCSYKTNSMLDDFLTNLGGTFGDVIKEQNVIIGSEQLKHNYFPEGLRRERP